MAASSCSSEAEKAQQVRGDARMIVSFLRNRPTGELAWDCKKIRLLPNESLKIPVKPYARHVTCLSLVLYSVNAPHG